MELSEGKVAATRFDVPLKVEAFFDGRPHPGVADMMYAFTIVDVFSRSPFGGNQLAVLPNASGLSSDGMQKIAREFNFAETTFVLPAKNEANHYHVRIFTPKAELAFAGHATVGTACSLVMSGHVGAGDDYTLIFELGVGPITVAVNKRDGVFNGTLTLSGDIQQPSGAPANQDLASILSLPARDVKQGFFAGVGLPFCFVQLVSREAVDRATIDNTAWTQHLSNAWAPNVFFFAGDLENGAELYARMSAPTLGVLEDPATGSACAALVGALAATPEFTENLFRLSVQQGVAMGRRSDIEASARKRDGVVSSISVSGFTAYVASGEIEVPRAFLSS
jgi:trans-2,3-dihydro-3-hydroxyanthranilate isomerase